MTLESVTDAAMLFQKQQKHTFSSSMHPDASIDNHFTGIFQILIFDFFSCLGNRSGKMTENEK